MVATLEGCILIPSGRVTSPRYSDKELAFFWLQVDSGLVEGFQYLPDVNLVLFHGVAVDTEELPLCIVDEVLETGWGIGESKGHDYILKESVAGSKGGFPFRSLGHPEHVVGASHTQFRTPLGTLQAGEGLLNQRKGYRFLMVMSLRPRQSTQSRSDPSAFLTKSTGTAAGDELGRINPFARYSLKAVHSLWNMP